MRAIGATVLGGMVLAAGIQPAVGLQTADGSNAGRSQSFKSLPADSTIAAASIVREIDDPHSGARWLLLLNALHPGEPGRLVQADTVRVVASQPETGGQRPPVPPKPVIHAGERVILEEHSQVVDGRLDAVALNPAPVGGALRVRLVVGGCVVRSVAVGPGRVALDEEKEGRP